MRYSDIHKQLNANEISLVTAWKRVKALQKPWNTKEWKVKRADIIKDKCEYCNSTDSLTIHYSPAIHIQKKSITNDIYSKHRQSVISKIPQVTYNDIECFVNTEGNVPTKTLCPVCCVLLTEDLYCKKCKMYHTDIEEATKVVRVSSGYVPWYTDIGLTKLHNKIRYELVNVAWDAYIAINKDLIDLEIFNANYIWYIEYMKMINTKTLCKKCAYKEHSNYNII